MTATKGVIVTVKKINDFMTELQKDPAKLKRFLRDVMGPMCRQLDENEADKMLVVFALTEPIETSNNQRTITEVYEHAGKTYHVTYGLEDYPIVEEILKDDIQ